MKNQKVMYVLIIIFCTLAVIAGVYAQFFVKNSSKKENTVDKQEVEQQQEEVKEKTQEEIKAQLMDGFTNTLNKKGYDVSNINKLEPESEIVVFQNFKDQKENYELNINYPVMNIAGDVPKEFNDITQKVFLDEANKIMSSNSKEYVIYNVDYVADINEDILSVVIKATLKEGANPQRITMQTYNYNLKTGEKVTLQDVLSKKGLVLDEVQKKINSTVEKAKKEADVLVQSGYTVYNRELDNKMYKIENISNFFIGQDGEIYIIFAYGNQNHTSEMDVILYEFPKKEEKTDKNNVNNIINSGANVQTNIN